MKKIYHPKAFYWLSLTTKHAASRVMAVFFTLSLFYSGQGFAQLLQWNTFGNAGTETTEPSTTNSPNIAPANLTLGPGVTASANANRFGGSNWFNTGNTNPSTIANAVAGNDYIQFIVTPITGFSFTPTSFVFNWDKSGTGPQNVALRSSADNFATNLGTVAPTASIATANSINITGLTALTSATTFRVYGYAATATAGTGGFDIGTNINNIKLNGTTAASCNNPVINTVSVTQPSCAIPTGTIVIDASGTALEYSSNAGNSWQPANSFSGLAAGNYTVQVRSTAGCITSYASNPVVVNAAPGPYTITASAGSNGSVTPAGTSTVNCGTNNTYSITAAACYAIADVLVDGVSQGAVSTYTFNNTSANHTISASFIATGPVTAPVVGGPKNVCQYVGTNQQVTYSVTPVTNAASYTWVVSPGVTLVSGQGTTSITVTFGPAFSAAANKRILVTANSACGNSTQTIYYLLAQFPGSARPITAGSSNICDFIGTGNAVSYTINAVPGASSYNWTSQAGTTTIFHANGSGVNDTTVLVTFENGFTTSAITVQAVNNCGSGSIRSLTIVRGNPSTPAPISGNTNVCANVAPSGVAAGYSVMPVSGATSYTWTAPNGAVITHPNGSGANDINITVLFPAGFTSGEITVSASSSCGTSGTRTLAVVTLQPSAPSGIDSVQTSSCPNRVYTYSLQSQPLNSTSVQWTIPAAGTLLSGQGTNSISVSYPPTAVTGTVSAAAVNNCGVSSARTIKIILTDCDTPPPPPPPPFGKGSAGTIVPADNMQVNIFPNPSVNGFNLRVVSTGSEKIQVRILDLQGRELKKIIVGSLQTIFFGNDLNPGNYFAEITQGQSKTVKKIIKF